MTELAVPARADRIAPVTPKRSVKVRMCLVPEHLRATFGKEAKKPMILGIFLMSMQQLSGIDGVIYVIVSLPASVTY